MTHATHEKTDHSRHAARPIVKKMRWPFPIIWIVPIAAASVVAYYVFDTFVERGPLITLTFTDVTGLKAGQTEMMHLGVTIGKVVDCQLSPDHKQALVHIRMNHSQDDFARKGARFWIVRPEISTQEISGLGTILSGPFINAIPGTGEKQTQFSGMETPPATVDDGLHIVLKCPHVDRMQSGAPVYFRGIQVGIIEGIALSDEADSADIRVFIQRRFAPLVWSNSQFWIVPAVDLKGGLITGLQMKVESLSSLLSGGISFATPAQNMGQRSQDGSEFVLHDEPKKEWQDWAPEIKIDPGDSNNQPNSTGLPQAPETIRSAVGS